MTVAKELGEETTSDPDTLERFLSWAFQKCRDWDPSAHVLFHASGHGNGWIGLSDDGDIQNGEMALAIQSSMNAVSPPIAKLALVGFDACLMQHFVPITVYSQLADLYLASEDGEPANGWDFSTLD